MFLYRIHEPRKSLHVFSVIYILSLLYLKLQR
uniref:Uncharacterized protein n=1 Tax=Setaria italica TaxID=4555 RepID=K3ZP86_SETIT